MSKVGQWVFAMQEDAYEMSRTEFEAKHGKSYLDIWDRVNNEEHDLEPDPEAYA